MNPINQNTISVNSTSLSNQAVSSSPPSSSASSSSLSSASQQPMGPMMPFIPPFLTSPMSQNTNQAVSSSLSLASQQPMGPMMPFMPMPMMPFMFPYMSMPFPMMPFMPMMSLPMPWMPPIFPMFNENTVVSETTAQKPEETTHVSKRSKKRTLDRPEAQQQKKSVSNTSSANTIHTEYEYGFVPDLEAEFNPRPNTIVLPAAVLQSLEPSQSTESEETVEVQPQAEEIEETSAKPKTKLKKQPIEIKKTTAFLKECASSGESPSWEDYEKAVNILDGNRFDFPIREAHRKGKNYIYVIKAALTLEEKANRVLTFAESKRFYKERGNLAAGVKALKVSKKVFATILPEARKSADVFKKYQIPPNPKNMNGDEDPNVVEKRIEEASDPSFFT